MHNYNTIVDVNLKKIFIAVFQFQMTIFKGRV